MDILPFNSYKYNYFCCIATTNEDKRFNCFSPSATVFTRKITVYLVVYYMQFTNILSQTDGDDKK